MAYNCNNKNTSDKYKSQNSQPVVNQSEAYVEWDKPVYSVV